MVIILLDVTANAFDVLIAKNHQKVQNLSFSQRVITLPWPGTWPRRFLRPFISGQKVRKTTVFELKTVVFMVAEAGLEPTTSGL